MKPEKTKEENILIRWYDDGFPPIELHNHVPALMALIREVKELRKPDSEWIPVKDALRPFYLLAAEVGKNNSGLKDDRILYGYNKAEIKFSDLLKVIEVYESLPTTNP